MSEPRPLTEAAQRNLASGAIDGPGTSVCRKCGGAKEAKRLNSAQCAGCQRGPVTHSLRVEGIPPEVMAALAAEASARNRTVGAHLLVLLKRRHDKTVARRQFPETPS